MDLVAWPYRLTITRRRAATLFCLFADNDEEALTRASKVIAAVGEGALDVTLTCDGRRVATSGLRFGEWASEAAQPM